MTRQRRLGDYINGTGGIPAEWGVSDCTEWLARWIEAETGKTLPRAAYSSKREAQRLIADAGGLVSLWDGALLPAGIERADAVRAGDVSVVDTMNFGPVGCVWTRPGIAAWRTENGVKLWSPNSSHILASWGVPE